MQLQRPSVYRPAVLCLTLAACGTTTTADNHTDTLTDSDTLADSDAVLDSDTDLPPDTADTDAEPLHYPVLQAPMVRIVEDAVCALDAQGAARCWGRDDSADTGDEIWDTDTYVGTTPSGNYRNFSMTSGVLVGIDASGVASMLPPRFQSVSAYSFLDDVTRRWALVTHAGRGQSPGCGLTTTGEVYCNAYIDPPPVPDGWLWIDAGFRTVCGIHETRGLDCWGRAEDFDSLEVTHNNAIDVSVGAYTCVVASDGQIACAGDATFDLPMDTGYLAVRDATRVSTGATYGCALLADTSVTCWGYAPPPWYNAVVTDVPTDTGYVDIDVGWGAACAIRADGTPVCWGDDTWGRLDVPAP